MKGRREEDSEWATSKSVAGEQCCMGEGEGLVSITVDAVMKEHLSNRRPALRTKSVFFFLS